MNSTFAFLIFLLVSYVCSGQLVYSDSPNLFVDDSACPSGTGCDLTINIPDTIFVGDVIVSIDFSPDPHTWISDLEIQLISPAGSICELTFDNCPGDTWNGVVTFSDAGSGDLCGDVFPVTVQPDTPLSVFDGESVTGTWTLNVVDDSGFDDGILGTWTLTIYTANDLCTNAISISGTSGTVSGTNVGATDDTVPTCGGAESNLSVWYTFTPTVTGNYAWTTCGSNYALELAFYTGSCGGLVCSAGQQGTLSNSQTCNGGAPENNEDVRTTVAMTAGTTYFISVDAYLGTTGVTTGNFQVNWGLCDSTPATCPNDISVSSGAACQTTVSWIDPVPTQTCDMMTITRNDAGPANGGTFTVVDSVYSISYTLSDGLTSNNCDFTVDVNDNVAPTVVCPPPYASSNNAANSCSSTYTYSYTYSDNCDPNSDLVVVENPPNGSSFDVGLHPLAISVTDTGNNVATCNFFFEVIYGNQCPTTTTAVSIPAPGSSTTVTANGGTTNLLCQTACGNFDGQAITVYTFTGPNNGVYGVDIQIVSQSNAALGFSVFRCGVTLEQVCESAFTSALNTPITINTIPGAQYFVAVGSEAGGATGQTTLQFSYNLCALPSFFL